MNLLKEKRKIISSDIEKLLDIKERRAREILSNMAKKGILEKVGETKGSYYILLQTSEN